MINDKIRKIMKQKMEKRHFQTPFDNNQQNMSFSTKK